MIEMFARLYCDRCEALITELINVDTLAEAEDRVESGGGDGGTYALDEDGKDVCAACWKKWEAKHPARSGSVSFSSLTTEGSATAGPGTQIGEVDGAVHQVSIAQTCQSAVSGVWGVQQPTGFDLVGASESEHSHGATSAVRAETDPQGVPAKKEYKASQADILNAVRVEVKRIGSIKGAVAQWAGAQSVLYMLEKFLSDPARVQSDPASLTIGSATKGLSDV